MSTVKPIDLDNWRDPDRVTTAFQRLEELVPTATIYGTAALGASSDNWKVDSANHLDHLNRLSFAAPNDAKASLHEMLAYLVSDALVVVKDGDIVLEHYAPHYDRYRPHTLFSVSKSLTSVLAGELVANGKLDVSQTPASYLKDLEGSAYATCTIQQLLDMQIAIDFNESYLDRTGQFHRYRMAMQWVPQAPDQPRHSLRSFAGSLQRLPAEHAHGDIFRYRSPNSDVLGMLVEELHGERFADLFARKIWQPAGAFGDARVTLDHEGGSRTGGGILATARDAARFAELVRNEGRVGQEQVVPESWMVESLDGGDPGPWAIGDFAAMAPEGRYRNKWYNTGYDQNFGIGIHGQYIYVDRKAGVSIVHLSSHPDPLNPERDPLTVKFLRTISESFR